MRKAYPVASFEPCDNEIPFAFDLFACVSLIAPLPAKPKENLEKCQGAMRLRRFVQNQPICRQGEKDCTAFYILKTEDLDELRRYPQRRALAAPTEIAQVESELAEPGKKAIQIKSLQEKRSGLQQELEQLPNPIN